MMFPLALSPSLLLAQQRAREAEERAREAWLAWDRAAENRCPRCGWGFEHDHGGEVYRPPPIPPEFQRFAFPPDVVAVAGDEPGGEPAEDEEGGP